ncbi:hypothetical protein GUY44_01765 [Pimelobacter simplex]|uniref:Esterase/lipase n=1 Tax=Nocardioides simplex TaxID=2045 RepID=A0A0A1DP14_NOCSI|nr:hypothetical protein [Pimelobacter simplex]AIY19151.1 Esterase/lipase [Pimelobacter simplex]MCG8149188.1 hypothetical protein [Pimelobacter simplex]GEB14988.1 hypothetical protein NSI01_33030 [Pimelobacter simplex]SFM22325.1 hypothetical protein SAMN05421671_0427 [Pimelobacter simplex]
MTREQQAPPAAAPAPAPAPTAVEVADLADKYDQMLRLADLFDDAGAQMRSWAQLGRDVLGDPDVAESAPLSPATWAIADEEVRAATTGKGGLLGRSIELDADALVLRATVLTYRWIDELQAAAYQTLGSIAGKAIGYLAPEVNLGGAIVAAGLIETDALDRDGVAAYLGELAEANPELMEHVTTGGGVLDSLQMRGLLTAGVHSGESGAAARAGGLRAAGITPLTDDWAAALRDVAVDLTEGADATTATAPGTITVGDPDAVPTGLGDLMALLVGGSDHEPVRVLRVGPGRLVVLVSGGGTPEPAPGRLRLVSGDASGQAGAVIRTLGAAVEPGPEPTRVMLVGRGSGGAAALEVATRTDLPGFVVDQVVTANAPAAQLPALPADVQVLSLEDRSDPVALLGSLINAGTPNRVTVVYDAGSEPGVPALVAGGRAADRADHPDLRAALERWRAAGYLRG